MSDLSHGEIEFSLTDFSLHIIKDFRFLFKWRRLKDNSLSPYQSDLSSFALGNFRNSINLDIKPQVFVFWYCSLKSETFGFIMWLFPNCKFPWTHFPQEFLVLDPWLSTRSHLHQDNPILCLCLPFLNLYWL